MRRNFYTYTYIITIFCLLFQLQALRAETLPSIDLSSVKNAEKQKFTITTSPFINVKNADNILTADPVITDSYSDIMHIERRFTQFHERRGSIVLTGEMPVEIYFREPANVKKEESALQNFKVIKFTFPNKEFEERIYLPADKYFISSRIKTNGNTESCLAGLFENITDNSVKINIDFTAKQTDILMSKIIDNHPKTVLETLAGQPEYAHIRQVLPKEQDSFVMLMKKNLKTQNTRLTYYIIR